MLYDRNTKDSILGVRSGNIVISIFILVFLLNFIDSSEVGNDYYPSENNLKQDMSDDSTSSKELSDDESLEEFLSQNKDMQVLIGTGVLATDLVESETAVSEIEPLQNGTIVAVNTTIANDTSGSENKTSTKVECSLKIIPEDEIPSVQLTNGTMLMKALTPSTTNSSVGECSIVLFYSSYCVFSARAAPHFNALARVFPGVMCYAIDVIVSSSLNMRYGLVAVPNVMLFHGGKPIARFNETQFSLERLVSFIEKYTGLQYNGTLNVTSADMSGPVPATLTKKVDYILILAWVFTICCICLGFFKSSLCHRIVETVKRTWQEAEAQHEHEE